MTDSKEILKQLQLSSYIVYLLSKKYPYIMTELVNDYMENMGIKYKWTADKISKLVTDSEHKNRNKKEE